MTVAIFIAFFRRYWKILTTALGVLILIILIFRLLRKPADAPQLNEKEIQESIIAVEEKNDKKLKEILADSDARVKNIDAAINQSEQNTRNAANNNYENWNTRQLAEELEKRK